MDYGLFLSIFCVIFLAELPDKTAFATLLMATRGKPLAIFIGVAAAFLVQTIVALIFGSLLGLLPAQWVHIGAGFLFIAFALHTWFFHDKEEAATEKDTPVIPEKFQFLKTSWKSFLVIFIAEWGDLTQLATASLAAKYKESLWTVFLAAILALWVVTAIATVVGAKVKHVIHAHVLKKVSTVVFLIVGIYFIWTGI
jgi:putative Ca2+/H+ antiporter (TMEM165/GDT1 family)